MARELIENHLNEHRQTMDRVAEQLSGAITACGELLSTVLRGGGKVLVMGNGGSAADAQHLTAELVGRFLRERRAFPVVALTTDGSILTAVANDYGFDRVFARQVDALAVPGDVVIGISTSGNSANVQMAFAAATRIGCRTVALLGGSGGAIAGSVDLALIVPTATTPRIQEAHTTIIHILCDLVERALCNEPGACSKEYYD